MSHAGFGGGVSGSSGDVPRLLVVCTANLVRSPLAASLFRERFLEAGVAVRVRSAGVAAVDGMRTDRKIRRTAQGLKVGGVERHRATRLTRELVEEADLVLTMTRSHARAVAELVPGAEAFTVPLRTAAWRAPVVRLMPGEGFADWVARLAVEVPHAERAKYSVATDIADPVGGSQRRYRAVGEELDHLVRAIVRAWPRG